MSTLALTFEVNTLPEGWEGTLDDFTAWLAANLSANLEGEFVTAQIGGDRPTTNKGPFYLKGKFLEIWNEDAAKYVPPEVVPIGGIIPLAGAGTVAPTNYLFCEGQLLVRADYGDLYNVIGTTWNNSGDAGNSFRLPDARSRCIFFSGQGYVDPKLTTTGQLIERIMGQYFGREDLVPNVPKYAGEPVTVGYGGSVQKGRSKYTNVNPPGLVMRALIRYR